MAVDDTLGIARGPRCVAHAGGGIFIERFPRKVTVYFADDQVPAKATADDGKSTEFKVICRIDTPVEVDIYKHGGILPFVLRQIITAAK